MSLKTMNCYQPTCDAEGCRFVLEGDVEYHYDSPEEAAQMWRESDGWTDMKTWICYDHIRQPHAYVGDPDGCCDRCLDDMDEHEVPA